MCESESQTAILPSNTPGNDATVMTEVEHSLQTKKTDSNKNNYMLVKKKTGCKHPDDESVHSAKTALSSSSATDRMTRIGSGAITFKSVHDMCQSAVRNRSLGCEALPFRRSQGSPKTTRCREKDFRFERSVGSMVNKAVIERPRKKILHMTAGIKNKAKCSNKKNTTGLEFPNKRNISDVKRRRQIFCDVEETADVLCTGGELSITSRGLKKCDIKIESHVFLKCNDSDNVETRSLTSEISQKRIKLDSEPADDAVTCEADAVVSEDLIPLLTDGEKLCVTEDEFGMPCSPDVASCFPLNGAKCRKKEKNRKKHTLGARRRLNFRCGTCKLRYFETEDELEIHLECHDGGPDDPEYYRCKVCEYAAPTWNRILSHLVIHGEYKTRLVDTRSARNLFGKFACPKCEQCFERKVNMKNHLRMVHAKESQTCDQCGLTLHKVDRKTFVRHQEKCRDVKILCNYCEYTTTVRSNMQKHMKVHNGEGFRCGTCSAVFPTRQRFQVHLVTHQADRPRYECEYCGMMFLSEDSVKKHCARFHQNSHESIPCPHCQYIARIRADLKKHIHTVHEKKNQCPDCAFSTNSEHAFEQHQTYHLSDRIFGCSVANCFYRASSVKQMTLHTISTHHMIGKHQCPVCQKYYKKKTHLLRHLVSHTGDQPYLCQECGQTFFSHSSYYRHRRRFGHDENREGIASVPQNITIQYLDNTTTEKQEFTDSDDSSVNQSAPEMPNSQTMDAIHVFPATIYEQLLQTTAPRAVPSNLLSDATQDLLCETKLENTNSLVTCVVEIKPDVDIANRTCFTISQQYVDEEQNIPCLTQKGSFENIH